MPLWEVSPAPLGLMTPAVEVQGAAEPVSKPGLPRSWEAVQPPPLMLMVQVKLADPWAPVVSVAVTVTLEVAAVVGVPEIRPLGLVTVTVLPPPPPLVTMAWLAWQVPAPALPSLPQVV